MKARNILFFIGLLFCSHTQAQNYTVKWGPSMNVSKTDFVSGLIYADLNQIIIEKANLKSRSVNTIEKYDGNFKLIYSKEIGTLYKYSTLDFIGYTGTNLISVISGSADKKSKVSNYNLSVLNDNSKVAKPKESKIASFDLSVNKGLAYMKNRRYVNSSNDCSPNYRTNAYLLSGKKIGDSEFSNLLFVIDSNGNKIWEQNIKDIEEEDYTKGFDDIEVNTKGDVAYIESKIKDLKKMYFTRKSLDKAIDSTEYTIYVVHNNGKDLKKVEIDLGSNIIESINIEVNKENDNFLYCGLYSSGRKGVVQGIFAGEIDVNGNVIKKTHKDFSQEFLDQFKKVAVSKEKDGNEGLSSRFVLKNFSTREDGGAYMVFEYFDYNVITYTNANGSTRTSTTYIYGDVVVTSINKDGQIDWNYRIHKYQSSPSYAYSSIAVMNVGNNIGIIYNENPNNLDNEFDENFRNVNFKNSSAIIRMITPSGKMTTQELFKSKEYKTLLQPKMCVQTSPNTLAIYGGRFSPLNFKDAKLGTITFEE